MSGILILDNYDSFTYNLVHLLEELGAGPITVRRNDKITIDEVAAFDRIVLSPGPGIPKEAGIMPEVVQRYGRSKPILGVCLGHQCIAQEYGGTLINLASVVHGKSDDAMILDTGDPLFQGIASPVTVGRYHSWAVERSTFPECLTILAETEDGVVMALRHREFAVWGVQFHPESVLTPEGAVIVRNWLTATAGTASGQAGDNSGGVNR